MLEPQILLERNAEGLTNWTFRQDNEKAAASGSGSTKREQIPDIDQFAIKNGRLTFRDSQAGKAVSLALEKFAGETKGPENSLIFSMRGSFDEEPLSVSGALGSLSAFGRGEDVPLGLTVSFGGADLSLDGRLGAGAERMDVNFALEGKQLADLDRALGDVLGLSGPYRLSGRMQGEADNYRISGIDMSLGGSDLSGGAEFDLAMQRPKITGTLVSRKIRLSDFQGGKGEKGSAESEASPYIFGEEKLPLEGLNAIDADLGLKIEVLETGSGINLNRLDAQIELANGAFRITPLRAGLAGGDLTGQLLLDASRQPESLTVDFLGQNIDYGSLASGSGGGESVRGTMELQIDLKGQGSSPRAIASSLNGSLSMTSHEGQVDSQLFKILAVGLADITRPLLGQDKTSRLNCFLVSFDFDDGLGRAEKLFLDSEAVILMGEGTVDLRDETLALDFDTATRQASLSSLAIPFNLRGTLKAPAVQPDTLGAARGALEGAAGSTGSVTEDITGFFSGLIGDGGSENAAERSPCLSASAAPNQGEPKQESAAPQAEEDSSVEKAFDNLKRDLGKIGDLFD